MTIGSAVTKNRGEGVPGLLEAIGKGGVDKPQLPGHQGAVKQLALHLPQGEGQGQVLPQHLLHGHGRGLDGAAGRGAQRR